MNIPENILSTLTDEQKKKVEAAKSPDELLAIANETGRELTLEQLESVSGGETVIPCSRNVCPEWGLDYCLCDF